MENTISKNRITKDTLILLMGLFYPALGGYIRAVVVRITGIIGLTVSQNIFDVIVWSAVIVYIILGAKKPSIKPRTVLLFFSFVLIALMSFAFTSYQAFSPSVLITLVIGTYSFFIQGSFVDIKRVSHKHLYIAAVGTLIISMVYSIYFLSSREVNLEDNMDFAYKVLPSVIIIVSWLFTKEKKKLAVVLSVVGTIFLLLQGTRGPLFCLAAFVCLMIYKKYGFGKLFFGIGTCVLAVLILFSSQFAKSTLVSFSNKIDSSGYSSRFITMMIEGDLSDGNGRDAISDALLEDIQQEPLKLRGMFADREATIGLYDYEYSAIFTDGTYAHSLWLEILYDWGAIFGGVLLVALFFLIMRLIIKSDKDDSYLIMLYVCTGFVHLFWSGSYLTCSSFFFLIGLALNYRYTKK